MAVSIEKQQRFVWPDALHKDFILAIFKFALGKATSEMLEEFLPSDCSRPTREIVETYLRNMSECMKERNTTHTSHFEHFIKDAVAGTVCSTKSTDSDKIKRNINSDGFLDKVVISKAAAEKLKSQYGSAVNVINRQV